MIQRNGNVMYCSLFRSTGVSMKPSNIPKSSDNGHPTFNFVLKFFDILL